MDIIKPVYSVKAGDIFLAEDKQWWKVDEIKEPSNWRSTLQVGEKVGVFTILASRGQANRRFYHHGSKLVTVKGK